MDALEFELPLLINRVRALTDYTNAVAQIAAGGFETAKGDEAAQFVVRIDKEIVSGPSIFDCAPTFKVQASQLASDLRGERGQQVSWPAFTERLRCLARVLQDELRTKTFLYLPPEKSQFYESSTEFYFGQKVYESFGGLVFDLDEALKCYALNRGTACVFHLMRALEGAACAVWKSLGCPRSDNNKGKDPQGWGDYSAWTRYHIEKQKKDLPEDWAPKREFYEDVHAHLTSVNKAWRNTTMHLERTYSDESAKSILEATKGLLRAIAEHVDQEGRYTA